MSNLTRKKALRLSLLFILLSFNVFSSELPLYWWKPEKKTNFGDELSAAIIEKIIGRPIQRASLFEHKLLAVGSIIQFATDGDVVWGSGINGNDLKGTNYCKHLDVRAVRGPLTQEFLMGLRIRVPSIFGDPALLLPYFFPEFKVAKVPKYNYIVIPHISEIHLLPRKKNVVWPTAPWRCVVQKITESKFVISSSLHGIIVAEAFGIPARFLRLTDNEPDFKYLDYYRGTGRESFTPARSVREALEMGGEPPPVCDLESLLNAFPYDYFEQ